MTAKSLILDFPACTDEFVIQQIMNYGEKLVYKKGARITTPGDHLTSMKFIHSGKIKVTMMDTMGYEKILYILQNGWFLREGLFIDNVIESIAKNFSIAEEDAVIYTINKEAYNHLSMNSQFMSALLRSCAIKRALLVNELHSVTFNTSEERVINLLLASADKCMGANDDNWFSLKHQYTHQQMALILGINRVTVSKVIAHLCQNKTIRVINKKIQLNKKIVDL